jgi:hypothetical protein
MDMGVNLTPKDFPMMLWTSLLLLLLLCYASPALAAWGEAWGTMIWGLPIAVPTLPGYGLIVLALTFSGSAAWMLRKRRGGLSLPVLLVLLAIPLVVVAVTVAVPNTFLNAQVTDADQVKFALPSMVEELQYAQKSSLAYEEMLALDAMASAFNDIRDIGQPTL